MANRAHNIVSEEDKDSTFLFSSSSDSYEEERWQYKGPNEDYSIGKFFFQNNSSLQL